MSKLAFARRLSLLLVVSIVGIGAAVPPQGRAEPPAGAPVIHKVRGTTDRIEMTVNTSRRLVLDQPIPEAQVNNPDVVELTPLAPNEVQVSAKSTGVTQVILWGQDEKAYTIDVIVYADAQELILTLKSQFPQASLKVIPLNDSVLISGYVDKPEHVGLIIKIAEQYYPNVINALTVSGVQQVLLHVKIMEVSRTKLRALGMDWAALVNGDLFFSGVSGLITSVAGAAVTTNDAETFVFNVFNSDHTFFGVLEALRQDKLAKTLAEPNLVAISGRPAYFRVGGEFGYQVNGGITGTTVEFKEFGTRLDFVAQVLGNGRIRLEVRPSVSEIDAANSVGDVPALKVREVETGVELQAGQTLALAGLVQTRTEAQNRGLPWVSELPVFGIPFRRVKEQLNEVELLVMVTPELVEALDPHEVPPCGPGMRTTSPTDFELFGEGHLEVPNCCPPGAMTGAMPGPGSPEGMIPPEGMILRREGEPAAPMADDRTAATQNPYVPPIPSDSAPALPDGPPPGFIGPVGYDVLQ